MTDEKTHGLDVRLTKVETVVDKHLESCTEGNRRTADTLHTLSSQVMQLREAIDRGLARVHGRIGKTVASAWGALTMVLLAVVGYLLVNGRPWIN